MYKERLEELYNLMSKKYGVIAVTLNGSQNYNLHTPDSDYDAIVFISPIFDDLYHGTMKSTVLTFVETERYLFDQVVIKDIRLLPTLIKKGGIQYYDALGTNNFYTEDTVFWQVLRLNLSPHLHASKIRYLKSVLGLANQPRLTPKKVSFFLHCADVFQRFTKGKCDYSDVMYHTDTNSNTVRKVLMEIKQAESLDSYAIDLLDLYRSYLEVELEELLSSGYLDDRRFIATMELYIKSHLKEIIGNEMML